MQRAKIIISYLALILALYPSSILGGRLLYGSYSSYFLGAVAIIILAYSTPWDIIKNYPFTKKSVALYLCWTVCLAILLYFRLDSFLLREILVSIVVTCYCLSNQNNYNRMEYWFRYTLIICAVFYCVLKLLNLDIGYRPDHGPLNSRDLWEKDWEYLAVLGILVDRIEGGIHFIRYSAHFLEPSWLWLYLFIFSSKKYPNIVDIFLGLLSISWFGLLSLIFSSSLILIRRHFLKVCFTLFLFFCLYDLYSTSLIINTKTDQFLFMLEKGFFDLPLVSLYGFPVEVGKRYGLGVLNTLSNYGVLGIAVYLLLVLNNLRIALKIRNRWTLIITLAFSVFSLKANGFILPHILYTLSLNNQYRHDFISFKRTEHRLY